MAQSNSIRHAAKRRLMHLRRKLYGLRAYIPGLKERHRLEAMVGPLGYWNELQRYQLRLLVENGLRPGHALLDIGCGPLQGGIAFIRYLNEGAYTGIDIDPVRIEAAQAQIKRHRLEAKKPRVVRSETFGEAELPEECWDFVWASQILYYFDDAAMAVLLRAVGRRLRPGGKFLGDIFTPDHYEFTRPENPGKYIRHTPESIAEAARRQGLQARCVGRIEQYGYPRRLTLRSNLLFEFTAPIAEGGVQRLMGKV